MESCFIVENEIGEYNVFEIKKANRENLDSIMKIYSRAREFMARTGNPNQWRDSKPYQEWIEDDIKMGKCYVCINQLINEKSVHEILEGSGVREDIVGVFYFSVEEDPTYKMIYEGQWLNNNVYGVIHRIASSGTVKGAGEFCLRWAISQCGNLRIDTHEDNVVMQHLLKKIGFQYCGVIHLENGEPRLAFQYEK